MRERAGGTMLRLGSIARKRRVQCMLYVMCSASRREGFHSRGTRLLKAAAPLLATAALTALRSDCTKQGSDPSLGHRSSSDCCKE